MLINHLILVFYVLHVINQTEVKKKKKINIPIPFSATSFLEVDACVSLKVATKSSQQCWNVFDQLDITIPCSATYFLEVGALALLKVGTKGSPRGEKNTENSDF